MHAIHARADPIRKYCNLYLARLRLCLHEVIEGLLGVEGVEIYELAKVRSQTTEY